MAKETLSDELIKEIFKVIPSLLKLPNRKMWIDYDRDADVLYISFKRPQKATDSEMTKDGILLRYKGDKLVGITILDVSRRSTNLSD